MRGRVVSAALARLSRELDTAGHQVTLAAELANWTVRPSTVLATSSPWACDRTGAAGVRLRAGAAANATTGWFGPGYPTPAGPRSVARRTWAATARALLDVLEAATG